MINSNNFEAGEMQLVHEDTRRIIKEYNGQTFSVQSLVVINDTIPLGNHFHSNHTETFYIIKGTGIAALRLLDKEGNPLAEQVNKTLVPGSVIHIEPFVAHAFRLKPESTMACFSSQPFNPDSKDIHPFKLEI